MVIEFDVRVTSMGCKGSKKPRHYCRGFSPTTPYRGPLDDGLSVQKDRHTDHLPERAATHANVGREAGRGIYFLPIRSESNAYASRRSPRTMFLTRRRVSWFNVPHWLPGRVRSVGRQDCWWQIGHPCLAYGLPPCLHTDHRGTIPIFFTAIYTPAMLKERYP